MDTGSLSRFDLWNLWDEFGLLLDLPRIPEEHANEYRDRLLDVMDHRAGPQYEGASHGINRELGLTIRDIELVIKPARRSDGQPTVGNLEVGHRADGLTVHSSDFISRKEIYTVPEDTLEISLAQTLNDFDITVFDDSDNIVSIEKYRIDWVRNRLRFHQDYAGTSVKCTYRFLLKVSVEQSLSDVISDLNGLTSPSGESVVSASLGGAADSSDTGSGLWLFPPASVEGPFRTDTGDIYEEMRIGWSPAYVRSLNDKFFIRKHTDTNTEVYDTDLEQWVNETRSIARTSWGTIVFDKDRWAVNLGLAVVPTLADAEVGYWISPDPTNTEKYRAEEAVAFGMKDPHAGVPLMPQGFLPSQMKSGIGYGEDLKVIVDKDDDQSLNPTLYDVGVGDSLTQIEVPTGSIESLTMSEEI